MPAPLLAPALLLLSATASIPAGATSGSGAPAPGATERLIAAVPAGAHLVGYCESLPRLREGAQENTWYRLLRSEAGEAWQDVAREALQDGLHGVGRGDELLRGLWDQLPGGAVVFAGAGGGGLVLEAGGIEARLEELLDELLAGPRSEWRASELEHRGLALECLAPTGAVWERPAPAVDPEGRQSLAPDPASLDPGALIVARGGGHLFFLAGLEAAGVLELARASIDGWSAGRSPAGDRFRSARAAVGGGGLELFVDLSPLMEEAREEIRRASSQLDVDPVTLLGLEGDAWMFSTLELFRGDRMEARGRLAIPGGGVPARALSTLRPLPADLLARVPAEARSVSAMGWDVGAFFDLVADVARELDPEGEGLTMEGLLETGKGLSGVDLEQDIVAQLSGLFLSYALPPPAGARREAYEHALDSVWLLGLRDGGRFQDAIERLIGLVPGGLRDELVSSEVAGADVYHFEEGERSRGLLEGDVISRKKGEWDSPGIAFAPDALLFAVRHGLLTPALHTLAGAEGSPSLLGVPRFRGAFDENLGAVAFGALELGMLQPYLLPGGLPAEARGEEEGKDGERDPFGRLLVWSVRPSAAGLDFRMGTR